MFRKIFLYVMLSIPIICLALPADTKQILEQVYREALQIHAGENANYIPELAKINKNLFAIAVMDTQGNMEFIGDADTPFPIESVVKPFVYALALQDNGIAYVNERVGLNPTGKRFNSLEALEDKPRHLQNPLVNAGAIQVSSLIRGANSAEKWQRTLSFLQKFSDGKIYLGHAVYQSEMATNKRNRAIAELLDSYGMMYGDVRDAVDRYTMSCSIMVTIRQLAWMGATLANKGVNPITREQVIPAEMTRDVLAQMTMNGLYENSGDWWVEVGIPAKSGVSGVILAVVPNKMAIAVYSPPIDEAGNSVRGQFVLKKLSQIWHLHLLALTTWKHMLVQAWHWIVTS